MVVYRSRSAWTDTSAGGATLTGSKLVGVAVHWPGTSRSAFGVESADTVAERIRHYRDFHVGTRGWADLGYNLVIDTAGRVWQGRTTSWAGNRVGAHCASAGNPDANHEYVGVLLLLGQDEKPTAAMIAAFADWYHTRFLPGWPGRIDVRGHGQVPGASTACPGPYVRAVLDDLTDQPTGVSSGDDMPETVTAPNGETWSTAHALSWMMSRLSDLAKWGDYVTVPNGETWSLPHVMSWLMRRHEGLRDQLPRLLELQQAALAATEGLDSEAVLARMDAHHGELMAAMDTAERQRDDILALVEAVASGERDAADVVDEIGRRLTGGDEGD